MRRAFIALQLPSLKSYLVHLVMRTLQFWQCVLMFYFGVLQLGGGANEYQVNNIGDRFQAKLLCIIGKERFVLKLGQSSKIPPVDRYEPGVVVVIKPTQCASHTGLILEELVQVCVSPPVRQVGLYFDKVTNPVLLPGGFEGGIGFILCRRWSSTPTPTQMSSFARACVCVCVEVCGVLKCVFIWLLRVSHCMYRLLRVFFV